MAKKKEQSPAWSFKNWNISEFLKGNWKSIKELLKWGTPLALSWLATNKPEYVIPLTIVGKAILDMLEYFVKQK